MFHKAALLKFFFLILLIFGGSSSAQLVDNAQLKGSQLEKRQARQYLNIFKGLFRSKNIVKYISDIPCQLIQTLESDVDQAKTFFEELQEGKTPSLITKFPEQVSDQTIEAFKDVIGIFAKLPSQIKDDAEAAVTDATKIFDDIASGAIVKDIEQVPGVIVSDITSAWGDLTHGLEEGWAAATNFFECIGGCSHTSTANANTCNGADSARTSVGAASTDPTAIRLGSTSTLPRSNPTITPPPPLITPLQTQTRPSITSTRLPESSGGIKVIAPLRIFLLCGAVAIVSWVLLFYSSRF